MADIIDLKNEMMCNWLYQQQLEKMWSTNGPEEGVILKKSRGDYLCGPTSLRETQNGIFEAVVKLNVRVSLIKYSKDGC